MIKNIPRPLVIFYLLVLYIFFQFCWWAYLIISLNIELANEQIHSENQLVNKKVLMVFGEGTVFLILLFVGFYQVRKSFMREVEVAKQQRNFLLSITHELNSPLASIKLYLQTLQRRKLSEEKTEQVLENALHDVERQQKLVSNILLAARVDDSSYQIVPEQVNISALVKRVCNQQAAHFSHEFQVDIEPEIIVHTDVSAFESIVTNLIENARKYSPKNTTVLVTLSSHESEFELVIEDEGSGIPSEEREAIFKKFYRSGNEDTRKAKGTGLGLYLVHFFVKSLKGTIQVVEGKKSGARFELRFPIAIQN
jgi:signal transduction histidine kinase